MLYAEAERHITEYQADTFYIGGNGQFDGLASGVLRELWARYPHIAVYRVLAYLPTGAATENGGDPFPAIYPEGLEFVPRRFAISRRNRWMVEQSQHIICYVQTGYGGAFEAVQYARRQHKQIINLAEGGTSGQVGPK